MRSPPNWRRAPSPRRCPVSMRPWSRCRASGSAIERSRAARLATSRGRVVGSGSALDACISPIPSRLRGPSSTARWLSAVRHLRTSCRASWSRSRCRLIRWPTCGPAGRGRHWGYPGCGRRERNGRLFRLLASGWRPMAFVGSCTRRRRALERYVFACSRRDSLASNSRANLSGLTSLPHRRGVFEPNDAWLGR